MVPNSNSRTKNCSISECGRSVIARGWCESHYRRWRRYGDPTYSPRNQCKSDGCNEQSHKFSWCLAHFEEWRDGGDESELFDRNPSCVTVGCEKPRAFLARCAEHRSRVRLSTDPVEFVPADKTCKFPDCPKRKSSRGYCVGHYMQLQLGKDLNPLGGAALFIDERFFRSVDKSGNCWNWTGILSKDGYGQFPTGKTKVPAHRFSYELHVGAIPAGMQIDHRCHNTSCVNPDHLRPVTSKQNTEHRRGAERSNPTGLRGVSIKKADGLYRARLTHNGVTVSAGDFEDPHEAAEAIRLLRLEIFTHSDRDRRAA